LPGNRAQEKVLLRLPRELPSTSFWDVRVGLKP